MIKSKTNNYRFWSLIIIILLFIFIIFLGYNVISLFEKERETSSKKELILSEISNLEKRQASFTEDISRLNTDDGKEEIIREKYQVAKSGEKMVIIVEEENKNESSLEVKESKKSFFDFIKKIFNN